MDITLSTLRYHINYLEEKEIIVSRKENNLKIYFVEGKLSEKDKNISSLIQQKRFRNIIVLLISSPNITPTEITLKLSMNPSTLSKYLKVLLERKIIDYQKNGREKRYFILNEKLILGLLFSYKKTIWDSLVDNVLDIYFER